MSHKSKTIAKLKLLKPNGGESIRKGGSFTISWSSSGINGQVGLLLMMGKREIQVIGKNIPVNKKFFPWKPGKSLPIGRNFSIKIITTNRKYQDSSDRTFSITEGTPSVMKTNSQSTKSLAPLTFKPSIRSCSKTGFIIKQGTKEQVLLTGANLQSTRFVEVTKNGKNAATGFKTEIVKVTSGQLRINITALSTALPAKDYGLRLLDSKRKAVISVSMNILKFSVEKAAEQTSSPQLGIQKPDLIITGFVQDPPNPKAGESWRFEISIKNIGTLDAYFPKGSDVMATKTSGSFSGISHNTNLTISPGDTFKKAQYGGLKTEGTFPVEFKVDPQNVVNESNENNNGKLGNYTVLPQGGNPDLIITNITVDTSTPTTQGFNLNVTLKNQGTGAVNLYTSTQFIVKSINTNYIALKRYLTLSPGQSETVKCYAVQPSAGTSTWIIKVDPDNKVIESNETNNTKNITLTIADSSQTPGKPDLIITGFVQDPPNPKAGESWRFEISIKNIGTLDAYFPKGSDVMATKTSGSFSGISHNTNLTISPGDTFKKAQYGGLKTEGTFPVEFKVDPQNVVNESNENNNGKLGNYTVLPQGGNPDLIITNITVDTSTPTTQGFNLNVTLKNQGTGAVNLYTSTQFIVKSINTNYIALKRYLTLSPGQSETVKCYAVQPSAGTSTWIIKVDPDNKVIESNETNNTKNITLTIK